MTATVSSSNHTATAAPGNIDSGTPQSVRITGNSLIDCLGKATKTLGVTAEFINFKIISDTSPSGSVTICASRSVAAPCTPQPASEPLSQMENHSGLDLRIDLIDEKLKSLDLLDLNLNDLDIDINLDEETASLSSDNNSAAAKETSVSEQRDGSFTVNVSDNRMHAFLNVSPAIGGGMRVTRPMVTEYLRNLKICFGIQSTSIEDAIRKAQDEGSAVADIEIATGVEAIKGQDEILDFKIKMPNKSVNFREDGSIDWHNSAQVITVKEHDLIAVISPATKGTPGKDIYGQNVPCLDGAPSAIQPDDNVEVDPATHEIRAKITGVVEIVNGKLSVCEIL